MLRCSKNLRVADKDLCGQIIMKVFLLLLDMTAQQLPSFIHTISILINTLASVKCAGGT